MYHNMFRISVATAVLTATLTLSACGRGDRWCEIDATDEVVDNSLCAAGAPGTEWEPDSDKPRKRPKSSAPRPPTPVNVPRPTGSWPPRSTPQPTPTVATPPPSKPAPQKTAAPARPTP